MKNLNIALVTDFGQEDIYPGVMKGVIASLNPKANVIDITHSVQPGNILQGAFLLFSSFRYFPRGTVFCAVVDPGVGSNRAALAVRTADYFFVGPDNGLMWQSASDNGIHEIIELSESRFFRKTVSSTFHGRDVFAPAAAHISKGEDVTRMGKGRERMVRLSLAKFDPAGSNRDIRVLHVDTFGNVILDVLAEDFRSAGDLSVKTGGVTVSACFQSYHEAKEDTPFFVTSSSGFVEIAVKNDNAAARLGLEPGDTVSATFTRNRDLD
ncbi:MAG: SAM-dependent chlorinase/fluorinase [Desulfarculaceae bacterium]|nr:SAM-dependent chlorinase/fluorinase [Desulfarculaceae bacterium]